MIAFVLAALALVAVYAAGRSADDGSSRGSGQESGQESGQGSDGIRTSGVLDAVTDGDTVRVRTADGTVERVRLLGLDAPEVRGTPECGGDEATGVVADLLPEGADVVLVADPTQGDRDRYDRLLRYVETSDGTDVGEAVLAAGWAEVYVFDDEVERHQAYARAEESARAQDRGIWGAC
ncbi:thermonuclease family protein [Nocardioides zeae]|uniref:Thermonuclease family protein n=1 Tax=Nocardioides imazamoxiresistens TaxID=3231893 RepID=A0ABU3Q1A7_9ACTN|nr:thermonuclease family protein [Nocardioides zeae]MDT9595283.1 thermonuclease family protein [Nocardioides zeae]